MKVSVSFESTKNEDGVDTTTTYEHCDVVDLHDLAWVFAEAARAGGFTYIESVGFLKEDDNNVFWGAY